MNTRFDSIRLLVACGYHRSDPSDDEATVWTPIASRLGQYTDMDQCQNITPEARTELHRLLDAAVDHLNYVIPLLRPVREVTM